MKKFFPTSLKSIPGYIGRWVAVSVPAFVALAAVVVLAAAVGRFVNPYSSHPPGQVCSGELLQQAALAMAPEGSGRLKDIAGTIQKLPGYQQDPNCMYVVTSYYVDSSNAKDAQTAMKQLSAVYKPKDGFDGALVSPYARSYKDLQSSVAFLQQPNFFGGFYGPGAGSPKAVKK